ncbi:MAG: hypothetical protein AAF481_17705 [Acidobacteriota bacterium]
MRLRTVLLLIFIFALCAVGTLQADDESKAEKAAAIAERVMEALGGEEAWESTRYLKFGFFERRFHTWDRATGHYRLEGTDREDRPYVVLMNLSSKQGRAQRDGAALAGEELTTALENAWAAWVNDTYWLLMPYKLRDPGVNLTWDSEDTLDGRGYDKLLMTFGDDIGLTPGDRYWVWVDRETAQVDRWAYVLQSQEPDSDPTAWTWEGWETYGGIRLAPMRQQVGGDRQISLAPIEVPTELSETLFTEFEAD